MRQRLRERIAGKRKAGDRDQKSSESAEARKIARCLWLARAMAASSCSAALTSGSRGSSSAARENAPVAAASCPRAI
jgi:hypothetical protein